MQCPKSRSEETGEAAVSGCCVSRTPCDHKDVAPRECGYFCGSLEIYSSAKLVCCAVCVIICGDTVYQSVDEHTVHESAEENAIGLLYDVFDLAMGC